MEVYLMLLKHLKFLSTLSDLKVGFAIIANKKG